MQRRPATIGAYVSQGKAGNCLTAQLSESWLRVLGRTKQESGVRGAPVAGFFQDRATRNLCLTAVKRIRLCQAAAVLFRNLKCTGQAGSTRSSPHQFRLIYLKIIENTMKETEKLHNTDQVVRRSFQRQERAAPSHLRGSNGSRFPVPEVGEAAEK
jgi:hypothetical protein